MLLATEELEDRRTYHSSDVAVSMAPALSSPQRVALCGGLLLIAVCLPAVHTISCYQCNSFEDPQCANVVHGNSSYAHLLRPCDGFYNGMEPFCRKMAQTIERDEPVVRIRRTCGWERSLNPCYKYLDDYHSEMVCQCFDDGCNAASAPVALSTATALGVLVAVPAFLRAL